MKAIYQKGNYLLQDDNGNESGRLTKEGTFSCKTKIDTDQDQVVFKKEGLFSPTKINRNGREIGEVRSNWSSLIFKLDLENRIHQLRLCRKSFWKSTYKLINEYKEELIEVKPNFKWNKLKCDYEIQITKSHSLTANSFVILLAVYGAKKLLERDYEVG